RGQRRHIPRARRRTPPGRRAACRADPAARGRGRTARRGAACGRPSPPTGTVRRSACPPVRLAAGGAPGRAGSMSDVVTITAIAAGGEGVGRLADGRAVFVGRPAPGGRLGVREGLSLT